MAVSRLFILRENIGLAGGTQFMRYSRHALTHLIGVEYMPALLE